MEHEILETLQDIRGMLYVLIAITSFTMFVWVFNWLTNIFANFKSGLDNAFIKQADSYFISANFNELVEWCEGELKKHPNHVNATWWLARAKKELGEVEEARALFERLLELEPSWKETHIDPYLKNLGNE